MNYELTYKWAGGFYQATRQYKHLKSALDSYVLRRDMLTNYVELRDKRTGEILINSQGVKHSSLYGKTATLLTVSGDKREVEL